jgi:two-component system nitrate/nitrite response regulator NarL
VNHSLISRSGYVPARWASAFPDGTPHRSAKAFLARERMESICWLYTGDIDEQVLLNELSLLVADAMVVVLTPTPNEEQAFRLISAGARGYCHAEAVAEQLVDVTSVIGSGGIWAPPELVARFVSLAQRLEGAKKVSAPSGFQQLTERELEVALLVGRGFNNREIADHLGLTDRTIKAHLTQIFSKLELRDRVQLALVVNRLPVH